MGETGHVLDYHVHLWPHGAKAGPLTVDQLAARCDAAAARGVAEVAVTEHLFRFSCAEAVLGGCFAGDPDPVLRDRMRAYWSEHTGADLDQYVTTVLEAQAAGLPVVLGLEVDHYAGRMDRVAELVAGYPFDVLLGSVHWIGAWGFDNLEDGVAMAEWGRRPLDAVWDAYVGCLEELAASGVCDVLAHPDLPKVAGHRPADPEGWYDRIAAAAGASGLAAEVSSAGWRKPAGEAYPAPALLARFAKAGVPVTTGSDAHRLSDVGVGVDALVPLLRDAGYHTVTAFRRRAHRTVELH